MEQIKKQECIELIKMIYRHEKAGGLLHIVLDEGNVEDDYVNYCVAAVSSRAEKDGEEYVWFHLVEMACISLISMMDEAERTEVIEQAVNDPYYEEYYPVTIVQDRYGGAYSDGTYTAWNLYMDQVPDVIDAGDVECREFWESDPDHIIGKGNTPNEAANDLFKKCREWEKDHGTDQKE